MALNNLKHPPKIPLQVSWKTRWIVYSSSRVYSSSSSRRRSTRVKNHFQISCSLVILCFLHRCMFFVRMSSYAFFGVWGLFGSNPVTITLSLPPSKYAAGLPGTCLDFLEQEQALIPGRLTELRRINSNTHAPADRALLGIVRES